MDRNTILAFLVCIIIYLVWFEYVMPYFAPPPPKKPQAPATTKQTTEPVKPPAAKEEAVAQAAPKEGPKPSAPAPAPTTAVQQAPAEEKIILDAPDLLIKTEWSNEGAALTRLILKDYFTDVTHKENVVLLKPLQEMWRTLAIVDKRARETDPGKLKLALPLDKARYQVTKRTDRTVAFQAAFSNGLEVTKSFEIEPKKYDMRVRITLRNTGAAPLQQAYSLIAPAGIVPDQTAYMTYLTSQIAIDLRRGTEPAPLDQRPVEVMVKQVAQGEKGELQTPSAFGCIGGSGSPSFEVEKYIAWAAVASNYFATVIRPGQDKAGWLFAAKGYPLKIVPAPEALSGHSAPTWNILIELTTNTFEIKPGESLSQDYLFYAGPKRASVLQAYGNMLQLLDFDYGMFGAITKLFLWMLAGFYQMIPNFGLGIIFLTLLVKVVLHPLTRKTQVSMYKMQKLQPKITALREKYKHDQKTLGQEQWKLFREHRVNPLGGCLPMFLQIPVLIALYNGIAYSIEFRQQPFVGWIQDLARPDALINDIGFSIPLLGSNQLNVLPIIMVATWIIQQATMPKPPDPQQAQQQKMMMFMPIIFGFMVYSMPAGLVLYWLVNTFLGIVEQYYIKKSLAKIVIE
jgi:YidC/Oxa1 family membrane protein insertase